MRLAIHGYRARVERAVTVKVEAFDWNCPQHIVPRFTIAETEDEMAPLRKHIAAPLRERIAGLEQQVRDCGVMARAGSASCRRPRPDPPPSATEFRP